VDADRVFGSWQADSFKAHTHTYNKPVISGTTTGQLAGTPGYLTTPITNTSVTGETETRPRNIALLPCIKY
jgi:hypothetical protein